MLRQREQLPTGPNFRTKWTTWMEHSRRRRCQELITERRQCPKEATVNIRFHALDHDMAFCQSHLDDYRFSNGEICAHHTGEHVHYDIVPMDTRKTPPKHAQSVEQA